jgi:transcriptional regulator with XRE-family HTH domain
VTTEPYQERAAPPEIHPPRDGLDPVIVRLPERSPQPDSEGHSSVSTRSRFDAAQPLLGRRLREVRRERKLSLAEVAEGTGISQSFISQVENGRSDITIGRLLRLVELYGLDVAAVLPRPVSDGAEIIRFDDLHFASFADPEFAMAILARNVPPNGDLRFALAIFEPTSQFLEPASYPENRISIVVRGHIRLRMNGNVVRELHPGDAIKLPAGDSVEWSNSGDDSAWVVGVNVGEFD